MLGAADYLGDAFDVQWAKMSEKKRGLVTRNLQVVLLITYLRQRCLFEKYFQVRFFYFDIFVFVFEEFFEKVFLVVFVFAY